MKFFYILCLILLSGSTITEIIEPIGKSTIIAQYKEECKKQHEYLLPIYQNFSCHNFKDFCVLKLNELHEITNHFFIADEILDKLMKKDTINKNFYNILNNDMSKCEFDVLKNYKDLKKNFCNQIVGIVETIKIKYSDIKDYTQIFHESWTKELENTIVSTKFENVIDFLFLVYCFDSKFLGQHSPNGICADSKQNIDHENESNKSKKIDTGEQNLSKSNYVNYIEVAVNFYFNLIKVQYQKKIIWFEIQKMIENLKKDPNFYKIKKSIIKRDTLMCLNNLETIEHTLIFNETKNSPSYIYLAFQKVLEKSAILPEQKYHIQFDFQFEQAVFNLFLHIFEIIQSKNLNSHSQKSKIDQIFLESKLIYFQIFNDITYHKNKLEQVISDNSEWFKIFETLESNFNINKNIEFSCNEFFYGIGKVYKNFYLKTKPAIFSFAGNFVCYMLFDTYRFFLKYHKVNIFRKKIGTKAVEFSYKRFYPSNDEWNLDFNIETYVDEFKNVMEYSSKKRLDEAFNFFLLYSLQNCDLFRDQISVNNFSWNLYFSDLAIKKAINLNKDKYYLYNTEKDKYHKKTGLEYIGSNRIGQVFKKGSTSNRQKSKMNPRKLQMLKSIEYSIKKKNLDEDICKDEPKELCPPCQRKSLTTKSEIPATFINKFEEEDEILSLENIHQTKNSSANKTKNKKESEINRPTEQKKRKSQKKKTKQIIFDPKDKTSYESSLIDTKVEDEISLETTDVKISKNKDQNDEQKDSQIEQTENSNSSHNELDQDEIDMTELNTEPKKIEIAAIIIKQNSTKDQKKNIFIGKTSSQLLSNKEIKKRKHNSKKVKNTELNPEANKTQNLGTQSLTPKESKKCDGSLPLGSSKNKQVFTENHFEGIEIETLSNPVQKHNPKPKLADKKKNSKKIPSDASLKPNLVDEKTKKNFIQVSKQLSVAQNVEKVVTYTDEKEEVFVDDKFQEGEYTNYSVPNKLNCNQNLEQKIFANSIQYAYQYLKPQAKLDNVLSLMDEINHHIIKNHYEQMKSDFLPRVSAGVCYLDYYKYEASDQIIWTEKNHFNEKVRVFQLLKAIYKKFSDIILSEENIYLIFEFEDSAFYDYKLKINVYNNKIKISPFTNNVLMQNLLLNNKTLEDLNSYNFSNCSFKHDDGCKTCLKCFFTFLNSSHSYSSFLDLNVGSNICIEDENGQIVVKSQWKTLPQFAENINIYKIEDPQILGNINIEKKENSSVFLIECIKIENVSFCYEIEQIVKPEDEFNNAQNCFASII